MDDMQTFERDLADVIQRAIGPERPVDAMAVARATATPSPTWRFQSVFSATKFVVAGAIVALFGGLLLAGFLARPSVEPVPGAVTGSPAPTTTETLLSGMTTDEIEPGVFRVIDDGHRELAADAEISTRGHGGDPVGGADIVAGLDGSVWWFESGRFYRLGDERIHDAPWPEPDVFWGPRYREVAPDGTLWSFWLSGQVPEPVSRLTSFDGRSWTAHDETLPDGLRPNPDGAMEVRPDGSVWVVLGGQAVARLTADGWERVPGSLLNIDDGPWDGSLMHLAVADATDDGQRTYRIDGSPWDDPIRGQIWDTESGPNGELWALVATEPAPHHLALFDGDAWRRFETGPAAGSTAPYETGPRVFEVAPDGSVWFKPGDFGSEGCDGIANFDGESVSRHLHGLCIYTADVAPDGHVWVVAGPTPVLMHAYVITPEAVAE